MTRRYPLEPLAEAVGCPLGSLGRRVGASGSTWKQYREEGVSELVADRYAVRLGLHPFEVWPEMADAAVESAHLECASCSTPFVPSRPWSRYCRDACRRREIQRKRRQRPEVRERKKEQDAAYRSEVREYRNRQRRAYYQANREVEVAKQRERDRRARSSSTATDDNVNLLKETAENVPEVEPKRGKNEGNNAQAVDPCGEPVNGGSQGSCSTDPQGDAGMVAACRG